MQKFILDGDGTKIYDIKAYDKELGNLYANFIGEIVAESANTVSIIKEHFLLGTEEEVLFYQDWTEAITGYSNFFYYGFSYIDEKIVPRAYDGKTNTPYIYENRHKKYIKEEYHKKLLGKNSDVIFDEDTALSKDTPESVFPSYFPKAKFLLLYNILLIDLHLKDGDELRGAASIEDTGLFNFKIK